MSIFGQATPATSGSSIFGGTTSSLFGNNQPNQTAANSFLNPGNQTNSSQGDTKSIFSSLAQPAQQSSLFGAGSLFTGQPKAQPLQTSSLFGNPQQTSNTQQTSSLFGAKPLGQGQTSLFAPQQQQQGQSSLFAPQQQQQSQSSLFAPQQQQQQQLQQQQGSVFGQQNASIFKQLEVWPRPRSVADQIEVAFQKWNPDSQVSLFQTYIYNFTDPKFVPFCQPGEADNPTKWEEAMSKKPHPGAVPVLVKGFHQLGQRMLLQNQLLTVLQGRLHEINNGLTELLRRHDLEISVRAAEARKRHLRLNQRCVRLATKVQVLRHRGYAMDSAEEELKKKLLALEKQVMDPALTGRGEEIWARMVSVRERGRQLQREFEKAGRTLPQKQEQGIDEEVMKKATKILEDYSSQLAHLAKELEELQKDFNEWNNRRPEAAGVGRQR
ncbi:MAG: hypothetical protein L6R42_001877 [Xanthoria sp. 1 TBL-2021]|nr:MAG: hypothetical protein L6R42_001877 [Xanthoria sp. 1 TBL-2021]